MPSLNGKDGYDSDEDIMEDVAEEAESKPDADSRTTGSTAMVKQISDDSTWNFLNYSVKTGIKTPGGMAKKACEAELRQLFMDKKVLVPVKWESLSREQRKWITRLHIHVPFSSSQWLI